MTTTSILDERISLTPAAQVAAREEDACAVLAAMLTGGNAAHYQALRRACRPVSTADIITTARILHRLEQCSIYLSADRLSVRLFTAAAVRLADTPERLSGYTGMDLIAAAMRIASYEDAAYEGGSGVWAALFEVATSALVYDTHNALTF